MPGGNRVVMPDLGGLGRRLREFEQAIGRPEPLLRRWGVVAEQEIQKNFAAGGRPAWKPLTPWTLAGRRAGTGGNASGGRPLMDTGALRRSWDHSVSGRELKVFSTDPKAPWHEFGVRPRAEIRAKNGKALALPALEGTAIRGGGGGGGEVIGPSVVGQFSLAGLERSRAARPGSRTVVYQPVRRGLFGIGGRPARRFAARVGETVVPYKNVWFRNVIRNWPGVPARPMLPRPQDIVPIFRRIAQAELLRALLRRASV